MTDTKLFFFLPSELVERLESEIDSYEMSTREALAHAYEAGADKQLEIDARWLDAYALFTPDPKITPPGNALRKAMRPKVFTLKEQALQTLKLAPTFESAPSADHPVVATALTADQHALIRRALESLPD